MVGRDLFGHIITWLWFWSTLENSVGKGDEKRQMLKLDYCSNWTDFLFYFLLLY